MIKWIQKKKNSKGFTLVELIVVIAILGILAALSVPRFMGMRESAALSADAQAFAQVVHNARIQELETGKDVIISVTTTEEDIEATEVTYDEVKFGALPGRDNGPILQKGIKETLPTLEKISGTDQYKITWTPDVGSKYLVEQHVTEGVPFKATE